MNQLIAMTMKKALYVWRTWYITLIQILMPVGFLILTIIIVRTWQWIPDLPALTIDMAVRYKVVYMMYVIKTCCKLTYINDVYKYWL
jgi:hypothetical protein